jgi:hypothetical protein
MPPLFLVSHDGVPVLLHKEKAITPSGQVAESAEPTLAEIAAKEAEKQSTNKGKDNV